MKNTTTTENTHASRIKTHVRTLIAIAVSAAPMVVIFLDQTELDTQLKAGGFLSGCLTALIYTINNPTGKAFIDRFMPWLLEDNQKKAMEEYVGRHRKDD